MLVTLAHPLKLDAVRLVPAGAGHASARYAGWLNDPDVVRFTEVVPGGHDVASVARYIEASASAPDSALFAIEVGGHGHAGNLRLGGIDRKHGRATVALMVGEKTLWGRGIGTRAIRLASAFGFGTLGLRKLTAGIYAVNAASRTAFERAGFACEATLRRHAWFAGAAVDVWQMACFADG